ncbi:MAG: molecular chaperone DnaJ [Oscillospiraceae bacterium]
MAAQKRDYYEVLGVPKGAPAEDIKKAYRKMAKENHPDLHPGDHAAEARFKEIGEAYEVLSDDQKRSKYDQFGHAGVDPNFNPGGGGFGGFGGDFGDIDLGDIFGSFFGGGGGFGGGGRSQNGPQKGESLRANLNITFEEAAFGCEKVITLGRTESCEMCKGSGCAPGTTAEICPDCRGNGVVRVQRGAGGFAFNTTTTCPRCHGAGKLIHSPCSSCSGAGTVRKQKKVTVKIPAGIDNGQAVSLRGQGNAGKNGGPEGDLIVGVTVAPHPRFRREGTSVYLSESVSFLQATLGASLEIPTLDGPVSWTLPEGTQTGTTFRLRGKGIPDVNGRGRGDQFITVAIQTPKSLTRAQREALEAYGAAMGEAVDEEPKTFFDKRKKKK